MARAARKSTPTRPRKAAPTNRGHGEKGVKKYDPSLHPRGPDGKFLSKGGASKAPAKAKTPKASKPAKPPAKPKKVGTAKQRKGLADQIRKARAGATTPEARTALLAQVRALRQKRSEWKRGQGKTQVEKLPRQPKPAKPPKEPKPKKEKAAKEPKAAPKKAAAGKKKAEADDPVMRRAKALQARYGRAGAKDMLEMSRLAGERYGVAREMKSQRRALGRLGKRVDATRVAAAKKGDLQAQTELLLKKPPAEMHRELVAFLGKHKSPASDVKTHGMAVSEPMHSVQFGQHQIHFPKGARGAEAAAQTARNLTVGDQLHPEVARHTKNIYLTNQRSAHDPQWEKRYQMENFVSNATGGDGHVVVYNGNSMGTSTFAHEAGHNLATARYGSTHPHTMGDFMHAAKREKPPTDYATKSPSEDFAESVKLYTTANATFRATNPLRYKVIDRMLRERDYSG